jgi:adenylate cyclase
VTAATERPRPSQSGADIGVFLALLVPLVGFLALLALPDADVIWEHHPSHFWLVLGTAAIAAVLGWSIGVTARRRMDARLFLVSLAFVTAACFLGLHALATPAVLLEGPNTGFVIATPVGLLIASAFALWSALPLDGSRARWVLSHASLLDAAVVVVVVLWGIWSLASLPGLNGAVPPETGDAGLWALAVPGIALYAVAAIQYLRLAHQRRSQLALAVAAAWALLAEAMLAVTLARNWHITWWEWHLLMLAAFAAVAIVARRLPESERFGDLYLDEVVGATRDVSVLFADLVGFTTFSEAQSSDDVQAMLNTYFAAVIPAVQAEQGRVDRYIGDAVMVTWNTSSLQDDHALRAARAAMQFQVAAETVAQEHPEWPRFRVGLNSGTATVGLLGGAGERGYTVLGDTVNLASRLEGLAPPGGVVISSATLSYLGRAHVSSLGTVQVKGRGEPVDAWLLIALDEELS